MDYYEKIAACQTEEELFERWKNKEPEEIVNHRDNAFVYDGIVDPNEWNGYGRLRSYFEPDSYDESNGREKWNGYNGIADPKKGSRYKDFVSDNNPKLNDRKIAFVLKETCGGDHDWSLTGWLAETLPMDGIWKRIIEWTYGIRSVSEGLVPYMQDIAAYNRRLLRQIAVVNLKKSNGKYPSDNREVAEYARRDQAELRKQLEIIAPDVIVCCSTFDILNREVYYSGLCDSSHRYPCGNSYDGYAHVTNKINDRKTTLVIDYYDPANHYPSILNYYGLTSICMEA